MAIFVPNSPLAGFNVSTGSLQGPSLILDDLTKTSVPSFLINGGAIGNEFFISSSNFNVKANGDITASNALLSGTVTATAGFIGGWTIGSTTLTGGNVVLDSTGKIRTATNFSTGDGFYFDDQATNNFRVGLAGGSRLQFTGTNIEIYSSNNKVVSLGTTNEIAGFGLTPAAISSSNNQLVLKSNGQITGSSVLFDGGKIGGFTINSSRITGSNIIIDSAGSIQTANYTPDLTGWKIDAAGNGTAEFENVKIRGTLSTAVFEKQSVNAVGGQLYVANSTTLTGSGETGASTNGQYTATQTTMSVENVTGFETGEIISAKRFSGTGFATEYMRINSASRANPSSQTDFSGRIYVTRALGSGVAGTSSSLGETPSAGQPYSGSQVIVSTGKLGTGFIRINANPNDTATPYIDIVERTGSGVYDVKLKARLGDLSGLSGSSYVFGQANPGFGLATDNVFLQGGITATFGSIGGFSITATAISSSNDDLILRSNGQITASAIQIISSEANTFGYGVFDSSKGILDAYNIGKQVYSNSSVYDFNTSTGGTYAAPTYADFSPTLTGSFYLLPGETSVYFMASGRVSPNLNNSASLNCKLLIYAEPAAAATLTGGGSQVATASWSSNLEYIRTTAKTTKGRNSYKSQAANLAAYTNGGLFTWKLQYAFFENTIATAQLGNLTIMTAREFQTAFNQGTEA